MTRWDRIRLVTIAALAGGAGGVAPLIATGAIAGSLAAAFSFFLSRKFLAALLVAASFLSGLSVPIGNFDVRPEQIAAPLVALVLLVRRDAGRITLLPHLLALAWLVAGLFGAIGEPMFGRAAIHTVRLAATFAPLVLLPLLLRTRKEAEDVWDLFLAFSFVECLIALGALASHRVVGSSWGITRQPYLGYVHPHGTLLEPNLVGTVAAALAVALIVRASDASLRRGARFAFALGGAIAALAVFVSVTRAAWVALPLVLVPALVVAPPSLGARARRAVRVVALAAIGSGVALLVLLPRLDTASLFDSRSGLAGKLASFGRIEDDPNVRIRFRSYRHALEIWREAPLLGAGHGAMERTAGTEDHTLAWAGNLEMHLLADTGLVGLTALLGLVGLVGLATLATVVRSFHPDDRRRAIERLSVLLVVLISAQATETSWLSSFWVVLGLLLAHASIPEAQTRDATGARDDPARILFVHPSDELYGSDRVVLELVRRLDRSKFLPEVALSTDVPYAGLLTKALEAQGVPVHHMRIGVLRRRILSPLRFVRFALDAVVSTIRLVSLIHDRKIDCVHVNTVTVFPAALAARVAGRPLVWHVHEIVSDRPGRGLLHALVRTLASRVVVVSEAARASLDPHRTASAVVTIPNGIEVPNGSPAAPPAVRSPLVAYVGRLSHRKGPQVLLEAFVEVSRRHPEARLVFAGDEVGGGGEFRRRLEAVAAKSGLSEFVEFRPFRDSVADLYAEATMVVSPSILPESFGLVVLEAMAAGRPVVASDLGGPRELVRPGTTGWLVPPGDVAALGEAISNLLADRERAIRFGCEGREEARRRFCIDRTVRSFERIYSELLLPSNRARSRV